MAIFLCAAHPICGGMNMQSQEYWKLFIETGIPEMYLMFNSARKMEKEHVLDDSGTGAASHTLQ